MDSLRCSSSGFASAAGPRSNLVFAGLRACCLRWLGWLGWLAD